MIMFLATDIFKNSNSLCVVIVVVVVAAAAVDLQKKIQPVAQPRSLDEKNYFPVLQHPKTSCTEVQCNCKSVIKLSVKREECEK